MTDTNITRANDHSYYQKGQDTYPPVTNVLKELNEDKSGLEYWRSQNDGDGDAAAWEHLFWYARHRGTIAHYEALNPLADRELISGEERDSLKQIIAGPHESVTEEWDDDTSTCMKDIIYSVMVNHYYGYANTRVDYEQRYSLFEVLEEDIEYFTEQFDVLRDKLGITQSSVIAVEQYLIHDGLGYGGQADLIYEDPDGNTVLADLKTSSGFRWKNALQAAAYRRAIEDTDLLNIDSVDRCEVIRINPDKHDIEVHGTGYPYHLSQTYGPVTNVDWYDTQSFFENEYGDYSYEDFDEIHAHFESLVKRYHRKQASSGFDSSE